MVVALKKVVLFTPSCPGCDALKQALIKNGTIDSYEFLDVSSGKGLEVARKLGVTHVPDCMFVKETEEGPVARLCTEEEFKKIVKG
ncbi:hypothetical protein ES702_00462 [subsurface metagenome]